MQFTGTTMVCFTLFIGCMLWVTGGIEIFSCIGMHFINTPPDLRPFFANFSSSLVITQSVWLLFISFSPNYLKVFSFVDMSFSFHTERPLEKQNLYIPQNVFYVFMCYVKIFTSFFLCHFSAFTWYTLLIMVCFRVFVFCINTNKYCWAINFNLINLFNRFIRYNFVVIGFFLLFCLLFVLCKLELKFWFI